MSRIHVLATMGIAVLLSAAFWMSGMPKPISVTAQSAPKYTLDELSTATCTSKIKVTNDSTTDAASIIVVLLGASPSTDGPDRIMTYSDLAPESDFTFPNLTVSDISATVFSLTTEDLSDIGSSIDPDDYVDIYLSKELFFDGVEDPTAYDDFDTTFVDGDTWRDVDLGDAYGPSLTVEEITENCS